MALIDCPECGNSVSDTAATCPKCGTSISAAGGGQAAGVALTTTQETSKKLKLQILISLAVFLVGLIWAISSEGQSTVSIILVMVGLVWLIATKARIWWHHK